MDRPAPGHVEDLAELANLDEQILLTEIRERYARNKIYVSRCVCVRACARACVCVCARALQDEACFVTFGKDAVNS